MDELLHHCLRELSFDGDLGCNVSRLKDFVAGFYNQNPFQSQAVDDAFHAFFWSVIVQHPTVRVGVIPPGAATEVYIAPQASVKRKVKATREDQAEGPVSVLDVIPNAKSRSLDCLKKDYGDALRIAVDPETSFAAITGSHIRSSKLSPMVYTALQFVTRGRENGMSIVDLGKKTKYDQKTCFYLVKQLVDLGLVEKVRRGGVGSNFCIHKYFYEHSPLWQQIRKEEQRATEDSRSVLHPPSTDNSTSFVPLSLNFEPMDARHLSSLPLVRARIVKLLKGSKNHMHPCNNILLTLGFSKPTKTDRRFFQTRIRELLQQGIIEKVLVPNKKKKDSNSTIKCFRLVASDPGDVVDDGEGMVVRSEDEGEEDDDGDVDTCGNVKTNLTIHKQIIDLLEEKGMTGMTVNELSTSLCQFDKRTIELLLNRAERARPPPHLSDLGVVGVMENYGRERRNRYYTASSYHNLVTQENLGQTTAEHATVDWDNIGGFALLDGALFYEDETALYKYQDSFKDREKATTSVSKGPASQTTPAKRGRPRKRPPSEATNDTGEDITLGDQSTRNDRVEDTPGGANESGVRMAAPKRKRGRPPKKRKTEGNENREDEEGNSVLVGNDILEAQDGSAHPTRKRGRPRKKDLDVTVTTDVDWFTYAGAPPEGDAAGHPIPGPSSIEKVGLDGDITDNLGRPAGGSLVLKRRRRPPKKSLAIADRDEPPENPAESDYSMLEDIHPRKRPRVESARPRGSPLDDERLADNAGQVSASHQDNMKDISTTNPEVEEPGQIRVGCEDGAVETSVPLNDQPGQTVTTRNLQCTEQIAIYPIIAKESDVAGLSSAVQNLETRHDTHRSQSRENNAHSGARTIGSPVPHQTKARAKVNVSLLRRENELYRIIETFGGVVALHTKEFLDAHMALVQAMAQAGEATSCPVGARLDKRTATATINGMERCGRVKVLKTSIITPTGVSRSASVVYLPDIEQVKLNKFLVDLGRNVPPVQPQFIKKIDECVEYGASNDRVQRGALPLQLLQMEQPGDDPQERWSKNAARAEQLFSLDDAMVRAVLLTERTTLAQLYDFIVAKALRTRKLHLAGIEALEKHDPSPNILSFEDRIIHLSYFCYDLPVSTYCSVVSTLSHNEELIRSMETDTWRETPVRDLPSNFSSVLQVGTSRAKSRFLDMLEWLRQLRLVVPLRSTDSDSPWISCPPKGDHPTGFDPIPSASWTLGAPSVAPLYWRFNTQAPLHRWAFSETSPPFWKDSSISSSLDANAYWQDLQEACTDNESVQVITGSAFENATDLPKEKGIARALRRAMSWRDQYTLTWHQTQYLKRFVDPSTGNTPLQNPLDGEAQIHHISWVVSAPPDVVRDFFVRTHSKIGHELDKARRRKAKGRPKQDKVLKTADGKALLSKKAAEVKLQREKDWDDILRQAHPEPLRGSAAIRVRRIHTRFLQSGSGGDTSKWEKEILDAVREAAMVASNILKASSHHFPPAVASNPPEKSIESLIAQQGPPLPSPEKQKRKKNGNNSVEVDSKLTGTHRRHRFQWNRDYDELARDASAIIKARCRHAPRLEWSALEQVFPAVPRNTVRQRLAHVREVPGNDTYLSRLEDKWYELWCQYRGTTLLPDEDPQSPSNFDLIKHIEFLRKHIDKNALRVGFGLLHEKAFPKLPTSFEELQRDWDVLDTLPTTPTWDFMWNATVEEGREKQLLQQAFTCSVEDIPVPTGSFLDSICLAESAVKMTFGTPYEKYDFERGTGLLDCLNKDSVEVARTNLLSRGILSKVVRDPHKSIPGRTMKISEMNQNAIGGSISRDTFQDALILEEISSQQEGSWQEWPLLTNEGDIAALFQLVSDDKVEFKIDTSQAQAARSNLDWNSKKADDDQIETVIHVQFHNMSTVVPPPSISGSSPDLPSMELDSEWPIEHGKTVSGDQACCKAVSSGLVDCVACLEDESSSFLANLAEDDKELTLRILTVVRLAGSNGITKDQLLTNTNQFAEKTLTLVRRITESPLPLLFWTGYTSPVVVSSVHLAEWTVVISDVPRLRVFPRRWLDIFGSKINDIWDAALRAVLGVILFRPGISQAELRWRLRSVYDRQEVHELLCYLQEEGFIKMRSDPSFQPLGGRGFGASTMPDNNEEKSMFWLIGDTRHWYQVRG